MWGGGGELGLGVVTLAPFGDQKRYIPKKSFLGSLISSSLLSEATDTEEKSEKKETEKKRWKRREEWLVFDLTLPQQKKCVYICVFYV